MSKDLRRSAFHHLGVNPFTALDRDWNAVATGPPARRAVRSWGEGIPSLAGYDTPAELVADIGRLGDPERSCRLLAHLLIQADQDNLAARAVLQAAIPGLRGAAGQRWRTASGNGPWPSYDDVAADTISAAWEAIHARAGEHHAYPARVIVRFAAGRLRRAHERWHTTNRDLVELTDETGPSQPAIEPVLGAEQQALTLITDALHARVIDPEEAAILIATAIHGQTVASAERTLGWAPKSGYRLLERGRLALRKWTGEGSTSAPPDAEKASSKSSLHAEDRLTVELPSHSMTPLVSPELCALLATLIRRRADLTRPGATA